MSNLISNVRNGKPITEFDIIDMHGHIGLYQFATPDSSVDSIIADMDRIGVRSIMVSSMRCMSADYTWGNNEVYEAMQAWPDRILGYIGLYPDVREKVVSEMHLRVKQGFSGLKLHDAVGFNYLDPIWQEAVAIANTHRLPILLHTWGRDSDFQAVSEMASAFKHCSFLLGHAGCCEEKKYYAIAEEFDNVYLDPTFSRATRGFVAHMVKAVGAEKVVFGSDSSFFSLAHQFGKMFGCGLTDKDIQTITSENPKRLLSMRVS